MLTRSEWKATRKERLQNHFHRYKDDSSYQDMTSEVKNKLHKPCPHCHSFSTVRYGKYRDRQRYKCKDCTRTFNDFTNTPMHRTHYPQKWTKFLQCIREGLSLRRSQIHVGVSWVTLFYWRHKFIHALLLHERQAGNPPATPFSKPSHRRLTGEVYPYVCVKNNPPLYEVHYWERESFKTWIAPFDWIARKYVPRYIAWFHTVHQVEEEREWDAMKRIFNQACSVSMGETYKTLVQIAS